MGDHPFSAYLATQPEPQRSTLQAVAASIRKILPGAQECISYKGALRQFYDNGVLQSKGGVRDGQFHGPWSWYRKDGSPMHTGQFDSGAQVGVWRTFDRSGTLVKETTF